MESGDDGMIVVVIEEDNEYAILRNVPSSPIQAKNEKPEDADEVDILMEMAEKHGEHLDLDISAKDDNKPDNFEDYEFIEEELIENSGDVDMSPRTEVVFLQNEYSDNSNESEEDENRRHRWKMLRPSECKSYVKELKKKHPELRYNDGTLINYLAQVMKELKPPEPPKDFYRVHTDDLLFECIKCSKVTNTLPAAMRHYQEKHGPRYLICFACGVDFRSKTNLYKHEKRCNAPDAGFVLRARALMVGRKGRRRPFLVHTNRNKPPQKHYCEECPAQFVTKSGLTAHQNLHRGERPFRCDQCGSAYTSNSALARHKYQHSNQKFICDHCSREFKMKHALITHLDTHLPEKRFLCPHENCGRRFAVKKHMNIHIDSIHMNLPPPCACEICPKRFPRMSLLKVHMKKAHGMILMTRMMFFKSLPKLTETQVQQAKIFLKQDTDEATCYELGEDTGEFRPAEPSRDLGRGEEQVDEEFRDEDNVTEVCEDEQDQEITTENVDYYLKNLLEGKNQVDDDAKVIVIHKGEMVNVGSKSVLGEYEELLRNLKAEVLESDLSMTEM